MAPEADRDRLSGLLAATALGDRRAFAELYENTRSKLFAVSLRIVRERQIAEEVLQDSFVSIWNHAGDYARAKSAPTTWMTAIVRNRSLDVLRRSGREVADIDDRIASSVPDAGPTPDEAALASADARAISRCMKELEVEQRQAISLAFFHGMSHSELAGHIGRPLGTVKTHIRRGLLRLKDCLAGHVA